MQYTIVIPAHNESSNIDAHVTRFIENLPSEVGELLKEVIIVENGSTDDTLDVCRGLEQRFPDLVRIVTIPRGSYGEAIKLGMLVSRGTHLSILECDFLDSAFVVKSIAMFRTNKAELIVGSKRHRESIDGRPFKRRVLTAIYNLIFLRLFIGYPGTDTHGIKSIEAHCARRLCQTALTTDEVFQTEIVLLAWRLRMTIEEIPVKISEMRSAPVSVLRRVPKVLNTVWELKRSLRRFPVQNPPVSSRAASSTNSGEASDIPQQKEIPSPLDESDRLDKPTVRV
jgi:glycosyltransferase involved in cell wall biosynthesis